ncbi:RecB family exonuclease [Mycobacterium intracellulare]|uniref:PD-(D/E)XK nuclease family protein n=1 Tax=Mycobacterium intracellulare TaxID=1767 RepID=A0AAE4RA20_MYCIT|nr:PD-(D/E)XK nuclease family protein [Mycobacterium intracellulare]MDV6975310.1 PD-(D/E)XK nuclease family protein [Mycobacterium intracellulare]MDV6980374.1 PD-(D/E)XK nuclease family protein [Mycobacterium intracellulare]MDV7010803.1 PD-(D/E)XK nuclease family protein [Mycobacterium intracellulare]MDV7025709.1 PD-(D/E)XK nuclease family protein [Mycobacterium intracellulare]
MRVDDPFDPNPRKPRSVSQLKQYEKCPYSYYLARIERAWQRPAAWLPQGTAVHAAIEARERSGRTMSLEATQDVFRAEFQRETNAMTAITPNWQWWFRSGPYGGMEDTERRFQIGLEQVEKYFAWTDAHPEEEVWVAPDGTPAIELRFDMDLDGVRVIGFIDEVVKIETLPVPELRVRDHKTGNTPGDDFQLGVYSVAIEDKYGVKPESGDYYMAGKKGVKGKPTYPFDLRDWTRDRVTEKFHALEENLQAKRFDPQPDPDKCNFCNVSYSCQYAAG